MNRFEYEQWGAKAGAARGEALPHARLTEAQAREIRANHKTTTAKQQAAQYGVHYRTIEKVRYYDTWGSV